MICVRMKLQKYGAKSVTADSCFSLIGPRQCSGAPVDQPPQQYTVTPKAPRGMYSKDN